MSSTDRFKPYQPDVRAVVRLEEALPPEHPVHVFVDLVQGVDLQHFLIPPGPKGEKPYHPHALFGILAWGYLHGVRSARKLARLARQEATFVYLAGGGQPNYRTLARFRRDNAVAFTAVFQETVVLALRVGLARLGHVALDGTKLKANTSKHKAMSSGRMRQREAQLKEEIARLVEQAETQDTAEDREYGADSDGYSVAEELARREARLAKIRAARERLEAEQRAEQGLPADAAPAIADKEQRSFADGDARIMLMKRGAYDYAYNAQAVVDAESGVIVAAMLTNIAADMRHLPDLVAEVRTLRDGAGLLDDHPTTVSADAGYFSGENAAEDRDGLDLLIAAGRDDPAGTTTKAAVYAIDRFGYDPTRDVWICPADKLLVLQVAPPGATGRPSTNQYRAASADCADCPLRAACLKPNEDHRVLQAKDRRSAGAMRYKLRQPDARRRYARRKTIVEPVFGQLKEARGFSTLSLRGLTRAAGEYLLACLAHNLGKLLRVCPLPSARLIPATA
ncbi:MAG: IS1182 family transposase [Chloroflexi bacterium]|nr:IS1182 family transposase [Chloroflexota bacterium]